MNDERGTSLKFDNVEIRGVSEETMAFIAPRLAPLHIREFTVKQVNDLLKPGMTIRQELNGEVRDLVVAAVKDNGDTLTVTLRLPDEDGSVTAPKLAPGSVNLPKLATGSVDLPRLADGLVTLPPDEAGEK